MEDRNVFAVDPEDVISDLREENKLLRKERAELRRELDEHVRVRNNLLKNNDELTYQHMIELSRKDEIIRVTHANMSRIESQFVTEREKMQMRVKELINTEYILRSEFDRAKKAYKSHLLELKCIISDLREKNAAAVTSSIPGAPPSPPSLSLPPYTFLYTIQCAEVHDKSTDDTRRVQDRSVQTLWDNHPWEEQSGVMNCQQFNAALRTHLASLCDQHDPDCAYYEAGPVLNVDFPYCGAAGESDAHFNAFERTSSASNLSKMHTQTATTSSSFSGMASPIVMENDMLSNCSPQDGVPPAAEPSPIGAASPPPPDDRGGKRSTSSRRSMGMLLSAVIGEKNFWRRKSSSLQRELWKCCPGRRLDKLCGRVTLLERENAELRTLLEVGRGRGG